MVDEFDNSEEPVIEESEIPVEGESIEEENDSIRNFDDNSIGKDSREVILRELQAFEESNDNGAINSMYWTELKAFNDAWQKKRIDAESIDYDWKYDPMPAMKANRFYTKAFGKRV